MKYSDDTKNAIERMNGRSKALRYVEKIMPDMPVGKFLKRKDLAAEMRAEDWNLMLDEARALYHEQTGQDLKREEVNLKTLLKTDLYKRYKINWAWKTTVVLKALAATGKFELIYEPSKSKTNRRTAIAVKRIKA